jgi:hypothetical protein
MPETPDKTLEMLERHHRDGARFAAMMKEGFERRYDDACCRSGRSSSISARGRGCWCRPWAGATRARG